MKILLLGEYSALHKNLKEGLQELGHSVTIAASRDGFKNIKADVNLDPLLPMPFGRIERLLRQVIIPVWARNYDVVQVINPFIFRPYSILEVFYKALQHVNERTFFLAAGDDAYYWRVGRASLEYGPFDDSLKYDLNLKNSPLEGEKVFSINKRITENSDGVIPVAYEYDLSYRGNKKKKSLIPLPLNTRNVRYSENKVMGKVMIFHGLNRYGFKGTRHVERAFEFLQGKYSRHLDLIIDGKMPLDRYLEVMQRANVIIDQTNSYSMGMNGIYALGMGKVVLGGAEPEALEAMGVSESPAINVLPSYLSIVDAVERILESREEILKIGEDSREFVEKVHHNVVIAEKYLKVWRGD